MAVKLTQGPAQANPEMKGLAIARAADSPPKKHRNWPIRRIEIARVIHFTILPTPHYHLPRRRPASATPIPLPIRVHPFLWTLGFFAGSAFLGLSVFRCEARVATTHSCG
jgi:hypothetical protein